MKKIQVFNLLIIFLYLNYSKADVCSETFEEHLKEMCENIREDSSHFCEYSNGICNLKSNTCDLYLGNDESICKAIILPDPYKKCSIINNKCTDTNKFCNDYNIGKRIRCELLEAGDSKRCILNNGVCEAHFSECEYISSEASKTKCETNIPSNYKHKCIWKDSSCEEVEKKCQDYNKNCEDFKPLDENKICITYESGCKEQYKSCQLYNQYETSKNKLDCENIKIYNETNQNSDDSQSCVFSGGECLTRGKQCSDILNSYDCKAFVPKDLNKECIYIKNHCKEQYKTCELYDNNELYKNKENCESIIMYDNSYSYLYISKVCTFFEGKCLARDKQCSDIFEKSECYRFTPKDSNKTCIFVENQCKEKYKTCKLYDENVANKNKEDCESISFCTFYEGINGGRCIEREQECSDNREENSCKYFIPIDTNKNCAYINNKCIEQYKTCEKYNSEAMIKNKEECESIFLYDDYKSESTYKCVFKEDKCLTMKKIVVILLLKYYVMIIN